ncbi:hypothetical protein Trydic_g10517 [Trypoxylus dichotomus]
MYKRPQLGESDEDLLKLQEEFLKNKAENKIEPAAKVDVSSKQILENSDNVEDDIQEHLSNTFEEVPNYKSLGQIIERKAEIELKPAAFKLQKSGFPIAKRRDAVMKSTSGSIFSQQHKKLKTNNDEKMDTSDKFKSPQETLNNLPCQSYIITGNERDSIHRENMDRLNEMTQKEILEERNKLISTMDPAIVAYLKSKRHTLNKVQDKPPSTMEEQIKAAEGITPTSLSTVSEILSQPEAEQWLNFDKMEITKLAWMKDVDFGELKKKDNYEARFDFTGWLLPYVNKEINEKNRILYHHGDEPGRPGYTLQELFQLCRSNIMQQKITALNSLANLLSLETSGVYDNIIDIPIEKIFFILRFSLDDNAPFVLNASIKAMRNLFYYPIDEACLDSMLGFGAGIIQPTLSSEEEDKDDDNTIKDQQLAETNLIKCLMRTEILTRIRYVINTVKPPLETICYCLEILIRLSRDSERISNLIFECVGLLSSIITHFMPKLFKENVSNLNYGVPLKQAVKLCRILSTRDKKFALRLINKYSIMDSILMYLSNDHYSSNSTGMQLQIESLHLWNVFVYYDLALEQFLVIQPVLLQMLHYHVQNTNQDISTSYTMHGHVAAILHLIGSVAKKQSNYILPYVNLLTDQALNKWVLQFTNSTKFLCGKSVIISSLLYCLSSMYDSKHINHNRINSLVKVLIKSEGFRIATSDIGSGSNILCKHEPHKPCKNLLTTEAAVWNTSEHIVPILHTNSCLPFLNCLSRFILTTRCNDLKISFLTHGNLNKYLEIIRSTKEYNLTSNWFTKMESEFLINILSISYSIYKKIDTSIFYDIAVKCLCIFNSMQKVDVEWILKNIIFNKDYYPSHALMQNLEIERNNSILRECVDNLDNIFTTYIEVLGLKLDIHNFKSNVCIDIKKGNIIPVDWVYSPIIVLYANSQKKQKLDETKLSFIVQNCLRWIYIYEKYFSSLASLINSADKFCRLACVFLLLEQYQGVSYGDVLFSNFILIPLIQKHNIEYRKLLWSEYAGIVEVCNITENQLMCRLDLFLQPAETDISLLKCYRKCIFERRMRDGSILKIIAKNHLDTFVRNKRSS